MIGIFITGMIAGGIVVTIAGYTIWFVNLQRKRGRSYHE